MSLTHLGIIMDGNRRWARSRGLSVLKAHEAGYETFKKITTYAFKRGVKIVTVFAFSTENWSRSKTEVSVLLTLFERALLKELSTLSEQGIQVRFIGDLSAFPKKIISKMLNTMEQTKKNKNGILQIAVNYGGREEIVRAVRTLIKNKIALDKITEKMFWNALYTNGLPDPDMIIRTSGEQRLSGFLPWQSVYSELYFTPIFWPDFTENNLDEALTEFDRRKRRFGS